MGQVVDTVVKQELDPNSAEAIQQAKAREEAAKATPASRQQDPMPMSETTVLAAESDAPVSGAV